MDLRESLVALAAALLAIGVQELRWWLNGRRRRAGQVRTRAGDWKPRSSGAAVWLTDDDSDEGDRRENGHGDPRADRG